MAPATDRAPFAAEALPPGTERGLLQMMLAKETATDLLFLHAFPAKREEMVVETSSRSRTDERSAQEPATASTATFHSVRTRCETRVAPDVALNKELMS